jgi:hypothetical protein
MANRYFVCSRNNPPVEFDVAQDRPVPDAEIAYFIRGFRILERTHGFDGYTVCFAWGSTTPIPCLGERVVAVIYGDEHCRVPAYAGKVGAVMKCHGLFPTFVPRARPLRLAQIEAAEFLRNLALWMPTGWRWLLSREVRARCHLLPLGYGIPSDVPVVNFGRRRYLTSFLGSVAPPSKGRFLRTLVGTPKSYSRGRLIEVLKVVEDRHGSDQVRVSVTPGFQESLSNDQIYAEVMAETKICVAPRGTTHETWRVFDGLKAGCVVIADQLPRHPFYANSPIIQIEDWRDLPDLIGDLVQDPARMQDLHERGLRHWHDVLSEAALARRYAEVLGLSERAGAGADTRPMVPPSWGAASAVGGGLFREPVLEPANRERSWADEGGLFQEPVLTPLLRERAWAGEGGLVL